MDRVGREKTHIAVPHNYDGISILEEVWQNRIIPVIKWGLSSNMMLIGVGGRIAITIVIHIKEPWMLLLVMHLKPFRRLEGLPANLADWKMCDTGVVS